ncbi:MAG TPA: hypothetical protein VK428_04090 [Acidimicrobiales bacterium]|nr:hypothetical protein [Acidimicrobiales bacterium]
MMLCLAVVLTVLLSLIAATIMTGAIGQLQLGSNATSRNGELEGALGGVQSMVAEIRAAATDGYVLTNELPCTGNSSNLNGLTNTSDSSSFTVSVQYQDETPSGSYTSVGCTQGSGPTAPAAGNFLARAVVTSCSPATACPVSPTSAPTGAGWRRVVSTYDFDTGYANLPGGLIYSYSGKECLQAVYNNGTNANNGVSLDVTTTCSTVNLFEEFDYTSNWNLTIELQGQQYCIQDPEDLSPASSSPVPLTTSCGSAGGAAAQWGVNDVGGIQGVETTGSPAGQPNGYCLANPDSTDEALANPEPATVESTDCDSGFDNTATWQLSPEVGAGGAQAPSGEIFGSQTDQLVNFEQFGNCTDVTNQSTTGGGTVNGTTYVFLIDYMCKQFPDTTDYPAWNQRWYFKCLTNCSGSGNPVGAIYTINGSSDYCLQSPLEKASSYPNAYVYVSGGDGDPAGDTCNLGSLSQPNDDDLLWTEDLGNAGLESEYTLTDNDGYCLEANTANEQKPSGNNDAFATIQVDTCNGSWEQKWNAPPLLATSQIANTHEGTGGGSYSGS